MKRACVIGWPIAHSRSPLIHGYWLNRYGIDGAYTREAVAAEQLAGFLKTLAVRGLSGCNVTVPHKEAAFRLADVHEPSAAAVGAANTLWLDGSRLVAANTDTYGYMTYLQLKAPGWASRDAPVSVLGAGGAAKAIIHGFLEAGVGRVRVFNRTPERAEILAHHFGSKVEAHDWKDRSRLSAQAAVLVNATTIGMKGESEIDVDWDLIDPACVVSDIVYVPLQTGLLRAAEARGMRTVDGLGMLLHQAVPGFERWFGVRPEVTDELYQRIRQDIEAS